MKLQLPSPPTIPFVSSAERMTTSPVPGPALWEPRLAARSATPIRVHTSATTAAGLGAAIATLTPTTYRLPTRARLEHPYRVYSASSGASTIAPRDRQRHSADRGP